MGHRSRNQCQRYHRQVYIKHEENHYVQISLGTVFCRCGSCTRIAAFLHNPILQHRRNVLVYGDSIYDYLFGVFKPENLSEFLSAPSHYNKELLFHNLAWFNKNFIRGHFRDEDLTKLADDIGIKINAI